MPHDDESVFVWSWKAQNSISYSSFGTCTTWHTHIHIIHSVCCCHSYALVNAYLLTGMPHDDASVLVWSWKAQNSRSYASFGTCATRHTHLHVTYLEYTVHVAVIVTLQSMHIRSQACLMMMNQSLFDLERLRTLCISLYLYCFTHTLTWHIPITHVVCYWHYHATVNAYSLTGMPHDDGSVFVWSGKAQNSMSYASLCTCTASYTHSHGTYT